MLFITITANIRGHFCQEQVVWEALEGADLSDLVFGNDDELGDRRLSDITESTYTLTQTLLTPGHDGLYYRTATLTADNIDSLSYDELIEFLYFSVDFNSTDDQRQVVDKCFSTATQKPTDTTCTLLTSGHDGVYYRTAVLTTNNIDNLSYAELIEYLYFAVDCSGQH